MQDMFYGASEPVWILKPEKDDKKAAENKSAPAGAGNSNAKKADDSILASIPYYPYYYPDYIAPAPAKKESPKATDKPKETKVVMKVPICCGECVELVEVALLGMKGVKSVDCIVRKEQVTVVATTAAPADILLECRRVFRKSRMWSNDE